MNKLHEYSGYTNKPTWLISLWIDNDEGSHNYVNELAQNCLINNDHEEEANKDIKEQIKELSTNDLADLLEDMHSEQAHELLGSASVFTDLMRFVLAYVNWNEVAQGYIEQALENMES